MKNKLATDVFDDWAINGKDKGMEEGHSLSVDRMVEIASKNISNKKSRGVFEIIRLFIYRSVGTEY